jgi:hypothetical protein
VDVQAVTCRQRSDVSALASLYGLAVQSTQKRVLRIARSPYVVAALPGGQMEVALACVLSRGADAIDVAAVVAAQRDGGGGGRRDEAVPLRKKKAMARQAPSAAQGPHAPRAPREEPRAADPPAAPGYKMTWCIDRG